MVAQYVPLCYIGGVQTIEVKLSAIAEYARREGITLAEAEARVVELRMQVRMRNLMKQGTTGTGPISEPGGAINDATLRARFCAVAWLSGASYPQLSALFKISRQAIQNKVNRLLDPEQRASVARSRPKLTYEQVVKMWEAMQEARGEKALNELADDALPPMEDKIG